MTVKDKYQSVLALGEKLGITGGEVTEDGGILRMRGTASTPYEKDQLWNQIKAVGGSQPSDIVADIQVADSSAYTHHTVKSGDTLGKIAKHYYDEASDYKKIFEANRDILDDADKIEVGQVLTIPNP